MNKALDYVTKAKLDIKSSVALSGDADPCGSISCALGQMAADGVHALVNTVDLVRRRRPSLASSRRGRDGGTNKGI